MLLSVELVAANSADRDILLTPNRAQQQPGKTAYFRALSTFRQQRSNGDSAQSQRRKDTIPSLAKDDGIASKFIGAVVPWEEPLKHAIYLVLNNKVDDDEGDEAVGNRRDDDGYGRTRFEKAHTHCKRFHISCICPAELRICHNSTTKNMPYEGEHNAHALHSKHTRACNAHRLSCDHIVTLDGAQRDTRTTVVLLHGHSTLTYKLSSRFKWPEYKSKTLRCNVVVGCVIFGFGTMSEY